MTVKRYTPCHHRSSDDGMSESENGKYVRIEDYNALEEKISSYKYIVNSTKIEHEYALEKIQGHRDFYAKKWDDAKRDVENLKRELADLRIRYEGFDS